MEPVQQATEDETVVVQRTLNSLRRMRYFRRQYDARRAYYYRQYLGQRDVKLYPDNETPRSNTYVPYPRSNVETVVTRSMDAFFSLDPPFETKGRSPEDENAAPNMQLVLMTGLHRAKWMDKIELHQRNLCIYGHAGIKVDWDFDYDTVTAPEPIYLMQPVPDPITGQPIANQDGSPSMMPVINPMTGAPLQVGTRVVTKKVPRNRPKLTPIDVFDLLVDPDGGILANLCEKTYSQILREAEMSPRLYDPEGLEKLSKELTSFEDKDAILIRMAEVWDETRNTVTLITFGEDAEAISWKDLRYSYRNANYSSYKRKVLAGNPILLYNGPNPYMHQRAPILHTSYCKLSGEIFGIGVVEAISDLSDAMNRFCNMITDNWNLAINRRYAYDVNADIDHQSLNKLNVPGGKVAVSGDPSKVIFPLPFFTPQAGDYQIMELFKNQIEMANGISDYYAKGMGGAQGNRTSSGINQLITESGYVFKNFIRNYETDILQPMLEMCSSMYQQFCTDYVEYQVTNAPPTIPKAGRIAIERIIGNYSFDFVGANYATNKIIKQRNMMAYLQIAAKTPYANMGEFLRETGKVMEIPNINRLIKTDQQVQQEQQQMMASQQQAMLMEKILDTESKSIIAGISKAEPNSVTAHAKQMQLVVEDMLGAAGELQEPPAQNMRNSEGRPNNPGTGSPLPGGGVNSQMRSIAQSTGANALGLGGLGE
jgi:hypothetical protein